MMCDEVPKDYQPLEDGDSCPSMLRRTRVPVLQVDSHLPLA